MKKRNRPKCLFNYLFSVYKEIDGELKGVQHYEYGFFRAENQEKAKEKAREIWKQYPFKRKWILVTNENGREIVNHSEKAINQS